MNTVELENNLNQMRALYNVELGVLQTLQKQRTEKEHDAEQLNAERNNLESKKYLLQEACVEARKNARDVLQDIATRGLQSVMGDHMSLIINMSEGGTPEAEFKTKSEFADYVVEVNPTDSSGGESDIVSMSNFLAMNYLVGKNNAAPIFLDEPTKYVSAGHSENVAKFLYEISSHFNKQVFMITHDKFLANLGDKSYLFELDSEGKTKTTDL